MRRFAGRSGARLEGFEPPTRGLGKLGGVLQWIAEGWQVCITKLFSLLRLAPHCCVLRSRGCQSGVNWTRWQPQSCVQGGCSQLFTWVTVKSLSKRPRGIARPQFSMAFFLQIGGLLGARSAGLEPATFYVRSQDTCVCSRIWWFKNRLSSQLLMLAVHSCSPG